MRNENKAVAVDVLGAWVAIAGTQVKTKLCELPVLTWQPVGEYTVGVLHCLQALSVQIVP